VRVVFAGTPEVALPALDAVLESDHDVVAVVTRPDARAGRGRTTQPSPVKERALDAGLEVLTPQRPADPEFVARLGELAPDCCAVVAYGALIPQHVLDIPRHGWVNLHFSLLPAWRGAAPVQRAILAGDTVTGASTFRLEAGLDTGPVYGVLTTDIGPRETAGELLDRLARDGAGLLVATLDGIADGSVLAQPQPVEGVSLAPKLDPADVHIDWTTPAVHIDRLIRAGTPAPGAWTTFRSRRLRLGPVRPVHDAAADLAAGEIAVGGGRVLVGTGGGTVELGEVRPEGKPSMPAAAWANGARLEPAERFE
jgi:methionyl-tRNA formyltransferase